MSADHLIIFISSAQKELARERRAVQAHVANDPLLRRFFTVFLFEEVWNPGTLPSPLTPESLRHPHGSLPRNHRLCEVLFLARYIEKYGTGTLMMIRESLAHNLPEPDFVQRGGEFTITLWRDWLTPEILAGYNLNDRQLQAIVLIKAQGKITNREHCVLTGVVTRTASRDLEELVAHGLLAKVGTTGRGTYYVLARKQDTMKTKRT